jgi:tetratricopeptide (TPR) repeat protein
MHHAHTTRARLTLAALTAALLGTACTGADAVDPAKALTRGRDYYAAGEFDKARLEFRNALQAAPNDVEARYQNGRVAERQGNLREAVKFYESALELSTDHAGARASLARMYVFAVQPERAMELVRPGLEKQPDDATLLTIRSAARAQLRDVAGAFQDAERAYALDPKNEGTIVQLAALYLANVRSDRAREVLEKGAVDLPESADVRITLAQLYATLGERDRAEATLAELVELRPRDREYRLQLARYQASFGRPERAQQTLREAVTALPDDRELKMALVGTLAAASGHGAAEQELLKMVAAEPRDVDLQLALVDFHASAREFTKAEDVLRGVEQREGDGPGALRAKARRAELRLEQNDGPGAQALIDEVLAKNPRDARALAARGSLRLATGDPKGAVADLRNVVRDDPTDVQALRILSRAHRALGEAALAEDTLRQAVEADPASPGARLELAGLLIEQGRPAPALALAQAVARERPNDADALDFLFRAARAANDATTARRAAESLRALAPDSPLGAYYVGLVAADAGDHERAIATFRTVLSAQPQAREPLLALVRSYVQAGRTPEALRQLDAAAAAAPVDPFPLQAKGDLLLATAKYAEADAAFRESLRREPRNAQAYLGLSASLYRRGQADAGLRALQDGAARAPDAMALRAELAAALEAAARHDDAIREYEGILKRFPDAIGPANNLAMLLATYRTDPASLARAGELADRLASRSEPPYVNTYGWVKYKRGDLVAAVPALERAYRLANGDPLYGYTFAKALVASGDVVQARTVLTAAVEKGEGAPWLADARATLKALPAN